MYPIIKSSDLELKKLESSVGQKGYVEGLNADTFYGLCLDLYLLCYVLGTIQTYMEQA